MTALGLFQPVPTGSYWPFFAGQGHPVRWSNPMQMGGQVHAITHSAKLIELAHQILGT